MGYVDHAKREFKAMGYKPIEECEDDPNKWIQKNVLELLKVFGKQGHSGSSAPFCIEYFRKLAAFEPLCPLQGTDDEWGETRTFDEEYCQNKRCGHIFKDKTGSYDSQGYVFWSWKKRQDGTKFKGYFTGSESRKYITFPYIPETTYVEVEEYEVNKKTNEPEKGSGWWRTIYPDWFLKEKEENNKLKTKE